LQHFSNLLIRTHVTFEFVTSMACPLNFQNHHYHLWTSELCVRFRHLRIQLFSHKFGRFLYLYQKQPFQQPLETSSSVALIESMLGILDIILSSHFLYIVQTEFLRGLMSPFPIVCHSDSGHSDFALERIVLNSRTKHSNHDKTWTRKILDQLSLSNR